MTSLNHRCLPLSRRRKWDEVGKCIGEISNLGEMDGMTYLAAVNHQASQLPDVFLAANEDEAGVKMKTSSNKSCDEELHSIEGSLAATNYLLNSRLQFQLPPTSAHLPACVVNRATTLEDWINLTLLNFSSLRTYLSQCRSSGLGSKEDKQRHRVPPSKDQPGWHVFCLGFDEASGNIGGYFQHDNIYTDNSLSDGKKPDALGKKGVEKARENQWDRKSVPPNGYAPTTALLCQFDQIIVRRVLSHHLHYISSGWDMTVARGRWMYALLARLEKPLHMDEASMLCSLLRELCRERRKIKLSYDKNVNCVEILPLLNILIVLTGKYFGQCYDIEKIMTVNC